MPWRPTPPPAVPVAAPVPPPSFAGPATTTATPTAPAAPPQPARNSELLLAALRENNLMAFCENFDARCIHDHAGDFKPFGRQLLDWTRSQFRFCDRIGLAVTCGRDSVAAIPGKKDSRSCVGRGPNRASAIRAC